MYSTIFKIILQSDGENQTYLTHRLSVGSPRALRSWLLCRCSSTQTKHFLHLNNVSQLITHLRFKILMVLLNL